jgi:molybdate transport system permease protein
MLSIVTLTLRAAAISTAIVTPLAIALAALAWRAPSPVRAAIDAVATLPLVLPPTAVGFILLQLLSRNGPFGGLDVLFTPTAVVIACAVMSFPLMYGAARASIDAAELRYFHIARTLGASPLRAFMTVTLPMAWRGLAAGVVLAFGRAIGEFGATILIAGNIPGRTQTLALAIYDRVNSGRDSEAMLLVLYVTLIALTVVIGGEMLVRRQRRQAER